MTGQTAKQTGVGEGGQTGEGGGNRGGKGNRGGTNNRTNEKTNELYAHAQINVRLPLRISQRQCIK